jgi:hypothetical protein
MSPSITATRLGDFWVILLGVFTLRQNFFISLGNSYVGRHFGHFVKKCLVTLPSTCGLNQLQGCQIFLGA